jgi:sigma-B regulation protein RsbU (phosphoserine phosphatase)
MLPRNLPRLPGAGFGAALRPCQHLAGDFYNAFRLDRDRVGFYLGDVMGHGAASALLGVYAMQVIRTKKIEGNSYEILSPDQSLQQLNRDLIAGDFPGEPFVTMMYAVLDVPRGRLTFSSAGHPPMLLLREHEEPARLDASGFVLGMVETTYRLHQCDLRPGDRVVMFSDGIETVNWGEHGPGVAGLARSLALRDGRTPQELIDRALATAVQTDETLSDDTTVLMVEIETD